jgi:hypothetical protein
LIFILPCLPNEPVEKVTFLKTGSSAGSKIGNYFLSSKVFTILGRGKNGTLILKQLIRQGLMSKSGEDVIQ